MPDAVSSRARRRPSRADGRSTVGLRDNIAPATTNHEKFEETRDLAYAEQVRLAEMSIALSNSFGFGVHNLVLLIRSYEAERAIRNT